LYLTRLRAKKVKLSPLLTLDPALSIILHPPARKKNRPRAIKKNTPQQAQKIRPPAEKKTRQQAKKIKLSLLERS
jgi:hypothetical protein